MTPKELLAVWDQAVDDWYCDRYSTIDLTPLTYNGLKLPILVAYGL